VAELLYLSRADVERLLDIDSMLDALGKALVVFSSGMNLGPAQGWARSGTADPGRHARLRPRHRARGEARLGVPANHDHGLPSHQGLIAIFDEDTGTPLAVMDGAYITAIRTEAPRRSPGALSRKDASVLAILRRRRPGAVAPGDVFPASRFQRDKDASARLRQKPGPWPPNTPVRGRGVLRGRCAGGRRRLLHRCARAILLREWLKARRARELVRRNVGTRARRRDDRGRTSVRRVASAATNPAGGARRAPGSPTRPKLTESARCSRHQAGPQADDEITVYKSTGHAVEDAATARLVTTAPGGRRRDLARPLEVDHARGNRVDDARAADPALRLCLPVGMYVHGPAAMVARP